MINMMMFVIMFFIILLLVTSTFITSTAQNTKQNILNKIDIKLVYTGRLNGGLSNYEYSDLVTVDEFKIEMERYYTSVQDLLRNSNVLGVNYSFMVTGGFPLFACEDTTFQSCYQTINLAEDNQIKENSVYDDWSNRNPVIRPGNIRVNGIHNKESKSYTLVDGRDFENEDFTGNTKITVVNENLTIVKNDEVIKVQVGDYLPLNIFLYDVENKTWIEEKTDFEIIGLYSSEEVETAVFITENDFVELGKTAEEIINEDIPTYWLDRYDGIDSFNPHNLVGISPVLLSLNSADGIFEVGNSIQTDILTLGESYRYTTNLDSEITTIGDIESMVTMFRFLQLFCLGLTFIFTTLFCILAVLERQKEIGLLISFGLKKTTVAIQLWLEILILSFIAFILVVPTSILITGSLNATLMNSNQGANEILMADSVSYFSQVNETSTKNIKIEFEDFILLLLVFSAVNTSACILAVRSVSKVDPKEILLRGDIG